MLVTVTNTSGGDLNSPDTVNNNQTGGPADLLATGGNTVNPLPYPFGHIGTLADTANLQLPMHVEDWRRQHNLYRTLEPGREWDMLINKGDITFAIATETPFGSIEDEFIGDVP